MARVDDEDPRRRRHRAVVGSVVTETRRRRRKRRSSPISHHSESGEIGEGSTIPDLDELRRLRLRQHARTASQDMSAPRSRYVYEPRPIRILSSGRSTVTQRSRKNDAPHRERHSRNARAESEDSDIEYVYGTSADHVANTTSDRPDHSHAHRRRKKAVDGRDARTTEDNPVGIKRSKTRASARPQRPVDLEDAPPTASQIHASPMEPSRRRSIAVTDDVKNTSLSRSESLHRSAVERPPLRRSITSAKVRSDETSRRKPVRASTESDIHVPKRTGSIFGAWFGNTTNAAHEKKITCLTCMADDVPISRSAKLACTHRMCHGCLRRIFRLSITDPAHMPPKCCTDDHIPLKHVEKLFDTRFKMKWNRKFQEFTTRNRVYCPAKGCGEWIKPAQIAKENGRKVGTCKRCRTRVCCACNNKMHRAKECPKDEATRQFIETAKEHGWQRCYNCSAMVELKEGCNHMTCRCTAEFCMICGLKWKSCDCPWFNYGTVEADRILNMNIPDARRAYANGEGRAPLRYQEELDRRREQEHLDEDLARRMQALDFHAAPLDRMPYPEVMGIGNAGTHFLNQDFVQTTDDFVDGNVPWIREAAQFVHNEDAHLRGTLLVPHIFEEPGTGTNQMSPPPSRRRDTATATDSLGGQRSRSARRNLEPLIAAPFRRQNVVDMPPAGANDHDLPKSATLNHNGSIRQQNRRLHIADGVSGLIGQMDPPRRATDARIERWRNEVAST